MTAVLDKENGGLGLRLTGGKGSKFGDIGIFICAVEDGGPAHLLVIACDIKKPINRLTF